MKIVRSEGGWLALLILALASATSHATTNTFTVVNTNNSGPGSFRAAIISANSKPVADTNLIVFAITNSTASGVQTIRPASSLDTITRRVIIDGYTQPGASSNTLVNGDNAVLLVEINYTIPGGFNGDGLVVAPTAGGSTIRGLVIDNGWSRGIIIRATNTVVEGCFIGPDPTGSNQVVQGNAQGVSLDFSFDTSFSRVGGTSPGARNVISGNATEIVIQTGSNQVVQGNFIGLDKTGTNGLVPNGQGILVGGAINVQIGGTNAAARNVVAYAASGTGILISGATGARVQGNFIGTDVTGSIGLGLTTGIRVDNGSTATQIGGATVTPGTPPGNVINALGGGGTGIVLDSTASSNVVQGNLIGTDATGIRPIGVATYGLQIVGPFNTIGSNVIATGPFGIYMDGDHGIVHGNLIQRNFLGTDITGTNFLGNGQGVFIDRSFANTISNNVIAGNSGTGVIVSGFNATSNAVLANSIFANGSLGIDLSSGGNFSQTNPVITGVAFGGGNVTLSGTLKSGTNASFRLEFFGNASCDGSGFGEGQTFLGFTNVTTDASGSAAFATTLANVGGQSTFTATATDTNGNTSEFSACASDSGPCSITCPANMVVSTSPNQCGAVVTFLPATTGNCGAVNSSPPSGSFFPKGTNTVSCTSASGTNCTFTITVLDTVLPAIMCPANIVTNVPLAQTNAVVNYSAPAVTDNCGVATTNSSPASGSLFPLGTTTVTCTATDTAGNTNTCSFTVTVAHTNAPPVAQCRNVTTNADASCQAAVAAAAVDNGSFDSDGTITNLTLNPPGPYAKGTNAVTFTVVDNLGASNSCAATIVVLDTTPPGITCPANIITNAPAGQTSMILNYPAPVVTDNCPGVTTNSSPASGSVFPLGTTTVNCTATDTSGNTNFCSFTVTVNPTHADRFWTNVLGGIYQSAPNWLGTIVPNVLDNAHFNSNATYQITWTGDAAAANAFFDASSGTVTQAIGARSWLLTNSYVVGQNAGSTATVVHASGTLRVTNSIGTAQLEVRRGTHQFNAGLIDVDQLVLTNTAGQFEFNGGTLITRAATITNADFNVGAVGSTPAILDARAGAGVVLSNNLVIGMNVSASQLLLTNGGKVFDSDAYVGLAANANSNAVFVTGAGSVWNNRDELHVGYSGSFNHLVISNGGMVISSRGTIGSFLPTVSNAVFVTGAGSVWSNRTSSGISVGQFGSFNQLVISDGGTVFNSGSANIGFLEGNSNAVVVTGAGSVLRNNGGLSLGSGGSFSQLVVSNAGAVFASSFTMGFVTDTVSSTNHRAVVDGGNLYITNAPANAAMDIRFGTNQLNSGLIVADRLVLTNTLGKFEFNGGTLSVRTSTVANGQAFFVGDGVNPALLNLVGTGVHSFSNTVTLRSNATLAGSGTISNVVIVQNGARLVPGLPQSGIGKMILSLPPSLNGTVIMEISKNGNVLTNDEIQLAGSVTYSGSLIVSNLGPTVLQAGDRFRLFSATSYKNVFLNLNLPPLDPGLSWTNKLVVDGSIEIIGSPRFTAVAHVGTNLVISGGDGPSNGTYTVLSSTNLTLALTSWTRLLTNQFDSLGGFVFTNPINPAVPVRFFRLQVP
jgi:T5SS/PEP-CTERM-associated repeat protein